MRVPSLTDPELFYESADVKCAWCERELLDDDIMLDDAGVAHCSASCTKQTARARKEATTIPYETLKLETINQ